ncbi:hypothetical protein AYI68_g8392 [Smittium mucronatum]|uniref:Myb-like domain-containing protein n=1 Tax=Smittium mucronatum TaxID=133383 RepID=A0A1R0GL16_9FUNG|nr:hypothetical protein AYI68_g8392 [Smittium mucronatum]
MAPPSGKTLGARRKSFKNSFVVTSHHNTNKPTTSDNAKNFVRNPALEIPNSISKNKILQEDPLKTPLPKKHKHSNISEIQHKISSKSKSEKILPNKDYFTKATLSGPENSISKKAPLPNTTPSHKSLSIGSLSLDGNSHLNHNQTATPTLKRIRDEKSKSNSLSKASSLELQNGRLNPSFTESSSKSSDYISKDHSKNLIDHNSVQFQQSSLKRKTENVSDVFKSNTRSTDSFSSQNGEAKNSQLDSLSTKSKKNRHGIAFAKENLHSNESSEKNNKYTPPSAPVEIPTNKNTSNRSVQKNDLLLEKNKAKSKLLPRNTSKSSRGKKKSKNRLRKTIELSSDYSLDIEDSHPEKKKRGHKDRGFYYEPPPESDSERIVSTNNQNLDKNSFSSRDWVKKNSTLPKNTKTGDASGLGNIIQKKVSKGLSSKPESVITSYINIDSSQNSPPNASNSLKNSPASKTGTRSSQTADLSSNIIQPNIPKHDKISPQSTPGNTHKKIVTPNAVPNEVIINRTTPSKLSKNSINIENHSRISPKRLNATSSQVNNMAGFGSPKSNTLKEMKKPKQKSTDMSSPSKESPEKGLSHPWETYVENINSNIYLDDTTSQNFKNPIVDSDSDSFVYPILNPLEDLDHYPSSDLDIPSDIESIPSEKLLLTKISPVPPAVKDANAFPVVEISVTTDSIKHDSPSQNTFSNLGINFKLDSTQSSESQHSNPLYSQRDNIASITEPNKSSPESLKSPQDRINLSQLSKDDINSNPLIKSPLGPQSSSLSPAKKENSISSSISNSGSKSHMSKDDSMDLIVPLGDIIDSQNVINSEISKQKIFGTITDSSKSNNVLFNVTEKISNYDEFLIGSKSFSDFPTLDKEKLGDVEAGNKNTKQISNPLPQNSSDIFFSEDISKPKNGGTILNVDFSTTAHSENLLGNLTKLDGLETQNDHEKVIKNDPTCVPDFSEIDDSSVNYSLETQTRSVEIDESQNEVDSKNSFNENAEVTNSQDFNEKSKPKPNLADDDAQINLEIEINVPVSETSFKNAEILNKKDNLDVVVDLSNNHRITGLISPKASQISENNVLKTASNISEESEIAINDKMVLIENTENSPGISKISSSSFTEELKSSKGSQNHELHDSPFIKPISLSVASQDSLDEDNENETIHCGNFADAVYGSNIDFLAVCVFMVVEKICELQNKLECEYNNNWYKHISENAELESLLQTFNGARRLVSKDEFFIDEFIPIIEKDSLDAHEFITKPELIRKINLVSLFGLILIPKLFLSSSLGIYSSLASKKQSKNLNGVINFADGNSELEEDIDTGMFIDWSFLGISIATQNKVEYLLYDGSEDSVDVFVELLTQISSKSVRDASWIFSKNTFENIVLNFIESKLINPFFSREDIFANSRLSFSYYQTRPNDYEGQNSNGPIDNPNKGQELSELLKQPLEGTDYTNNFIPPIPGQKSKIQPTEKPNKDKGKIKETSSARSLTSVEKNNDQSNDIGNHTLLHDRIKFPDLILKSSSENLPNREKGVLEKDTASKYNLLSKVPNQTPDPLISAIDAAKNIEKKQKILPTNYKSTSKNELYFNYSPSKNGSSTTEDDADDQEMFYSTYKYINGRRISSRLLKNSKPLTQDPTLDKDTISRKSSDSDLPSNYECRSSDEDSEYKPEESKSFSADLGLFVDSEEAPVARNKNLGSNSYNSPSNHSTADLSMPPTQLFPSSQSSPRTRKDRRSGVIDLLLTPQRARAVSQSATGAPNGSVLVKLEDPSITSTSKTKAAAKRSLIKMVTPIYPEKPSSGPSQAPRLMRQQTEIPSIFIHPRTEGSRERLDTVFSTLRVFSDQSTRSRFIKNAWTEEEIECLDRCVEFYRIGCWAKMIEHHGANGKYSTLLKNRTALQLKDKVRNIVRALKRNGVELGPYEYFG